MAKKTMPVPKLKKRPGADPRTQFIIDNAQYYCVHQFFGSGQHQTHEVATLEEANKLAQHVATLNNRPATVYAIHGVGRGYIRNFWPKKD